MGLENHQHATFLSISDGKICKRVQSPTQISKSRINKMGTTVYEEHYDAISGIISDITTKDHQEYGKKWVIKLLDNDDTYQVEFNYSSGYAQAFLKTLPNVDLESPIKLIPKLTIEGDKKKATIFINQHGKSLKHFYTKDNKNGIPDLEQKKVKGKIVYDDSAILEFLEDMINKTILPKLRSVSSGVNAKSGASASQDPIEDLEDAPF